MKTLKEFNESSAPKIGDRIIVDSDKIIDNGPWEANIEQVLSNDNYSINDGEYQLLAKHLTKIKDGLWEHE